MAVLGTRVVDSRTDGGDHAEDDIEPVLFQIDFVQDLPGLDVVQRHVRGFVDLAEDVLDPVDVFFEPRLANPREGHPDASLVEDHDATTPSEERLRVVVDRLEIHDPLDAKRVLPDDDEGAVHGREVDLAAVKMAVVNELLAEADAEARTRQTDGVSLHRPGRPDVVTELEHEVGVRFVRLGGGHLAVVDVR